MKGFQYNYKKGIHFRFLPRCSTDSSEEVSDIDDNLPWLNLVYETESYAGLNLAKGYTNSVHWAMMKAMASTIKAVCEHNNANGRLQKVFHLVRDLIVSAVFGVIDLRSQ